MAASGSPAKAKSATTSSKKSAVKKTPTKKAAAKGTAAKKGATKGSSGAKKGSARSRKTKAADPQLEGGWIEVFDDEPLPGWVEPQEDGESETPIGHGAMAPSQDAPPLEFIEPEEQDMEAPPEPLQFEEPAPEHISPPADVAEEPFLEDAAASRIIEETPAEGPPTAEMLGDDEDEEEDDVPAPLPPDDEPIHPEREPAPIEHPEPTPLPADEDEVASAMDDVGVVTMEEPLAVVATSEGDQAAMKPRAARASMPLSQEIPAKGDIASGLSLPEQFLLVAYRPGWDDKMTKARPGAQGAALVGSLLLELALRGVLKVQRGRFTIDETDELSDDLSAFAQQVRELGPITTQVAIERLSKGLPERLRPWVQSLEQRSILREQRTRRLGILARSELILLDQNAKDRLENRLVRTLAGGGNPDARTIMLLGLVSASGLLRDLVPASAYDFNRKRITALLSGRDTLSYRVDNSIRRVQDMALQTILQDIRVLQGT